MIITKKKDIFNYEVFFNTKFLGFFELQSTGGYLFFIDSTGGWSYNALEKIAEKLKEINEEFYKSMEKI